MLTNFRGDAIPTAFKERHCSKVTRRMFKAKPVFEGWPADTPESLRRAMDHDMRFIPVVTIVNKDGKDATALFRLLGTKFAEVKDIYHYLQAKSSAYPFVDMSTMRERFIKALPI